MSVWMEFMCQRWITNVSQIYCVQIGCILSCVVSMDINEAVFSCGCTTTLRGRPRPRPLFFSFAGFRFFGWTLICDAFDACVWTSMLNDTFVFSSIGFCACFRGRPGPRLKGFPLSARGAWIVNLGVGCLFFLSRGLLFFLKWTILGWMFRSASRNSVKVCVWRFFLWGA